MGCLSHRSLVEETTELGGTGDVWDGIDACAESVRFKIGHLESVETGVWHAISDLRYLVQHQRHQ